MSEIENEDQLTAQGEELDDFDVEGHALPEFMIAASIVATGVGATAIAMDNPIPGTTAGIEQTVGGVKQTVAGAERDVATLRDHAVDVAGRTAGSAVQDVDGLSRWAERTVTATTSPATQQAEAAATHAAELAVTTAGDATALAQRAAEDPIGTTDRAVDDAIATARHAIDTTRQTRDDALRTAGDTLASAQTTVASSVSTVQQTAADAADVAVTTASHVKEFVNPQVSVEMDDEGTTVQAGAAGASVTISTGG